MQFQTTQRLINNKWRYQANFLDPKAMKRAQEWFAFRSSEKVCGEGASLFTNDLQIIFEIRVHFDTTLKFIRAAQES